MTLSLCVHRVGEEVSVAISQQAALTGWFDEYLFDCCWSEQLTGIATAPGDSVRGTTGTSVIQHERSVWQFNIQTVGDFDIELTSDFPVFPLIEHIEYPHIETTLRCGMPLGRDNESNLRFACPHYAINRL